MENCTNDDPTSEELFKELSDNIAALFTLVCVTSVAIATISMFLEAVCYINQKIPNSRRRVRIIVILGIYPVYTGTALVALFIPRAHLMNTLAASVYFSVALFQFLMLIIDYYGGKYAVVELLTDKKVSLAIPPLTCCCVCLPTFTMTMRNLKWVKRCVMQVAFIRPFSLFIALVLWTDGKYQPGIISFNEAYIYLNIISICSGVLAIWGIFLMLKASQDALEEYRIQPKFYLVQMVLILISAQNLVLSLLVSAGVIPCIPPFRSDTRANYISDLLIIVEMFFFCILSRIYFRTRMGNMDKVVPVKLKSVERIAHHRHFSLTLDDDAVEEICANNIITTAASVENDGDNVSLKKLQTTDIELTEVKPKDAVVLDMVNHNHVAAPVLIKQENVAPVLIKQDNVAPVLNKRDDVAPVLRKRDDVAPVLMKPVNVNPVLIKPENVAPVLMKPENVAPVLKKPENVAPVMTKPKIVAPVMIKKDNVGPGPMKKENIGSVPISGAPLPIPKKTVPPPPIIAPVPIIKNNVTPGQVKKTRFKMPVLDSSDESGDELH